MSLTIISCKECETEIQIIPMFMGDYIPNCRNNECPNFDKQSWNNFESVMK